VVRIEEGKEAWEMRLGKMGWDGMGWGWREGGKKEGRVKREKL
jgi:hypothetical protein